MHDKRKSGRMHLRTPVKFGTERPPALTAFITDVSATGAFIKTNKVFRPGTRIFISINLGGEKHECEGVVVRSKRVAGNMAHYSKCGMGIRFTICAPEVLEHCNARKAV